MTSSKRARLSCLLRAFFGRRRRKGTLITGYSFVNDWGISGDTSYVHRDSSRSGYRSIKLLARVRKIFWLDPVFDLDGRGFGRGQKSVNFALQ